MQNVSLKLSQCVIFFSISTQNVIISNSFTQWVILTTVQSVADRDKNKAETSWNESPSSLQIHIFEESAQVESTLQA